MFLNIRKQLFILHLTSLVNLRIVVFIKVKIKLKSRLWGNKIKTLDKEMDISA